jgi:hypothetical protein
MDENLVRLDARLGALELLIRNLYAHDRPNMRCAISNGYRGA